MFMSNLDNSDKKRDFICANFFYKNAVSIYRANEKIKRVKTIANMEGHNAKDFWKQIKCLMGRGRTQNLDIDCNKLTDNFRSILDPQQHILTKCVVVWCCGCWFEYPQQHILTKCVVVWCCGS